MFPQVIIVVFICINVCFCVPPSPTDSLLKDVNEIKSALNALNKLPGLLTDQKTSRRDLEQRLLQQLTSIDSNVKNLQERAHVWDTFQLHVSAWNDQLSTTDRKLDILSKAQEKFYNLDTKLNNIPNLEYKLDTVLKKLEETDQFLQDMSKKLDDKRHGESLFGEFATRGILSTLKQVEKKLDRLQLNGQSILSKQLKQDEVKVKNGRCNIQPMDEMLRDVSSKVDVIFDKFSEKDDVYEEDYFGEPQTGSGEMSDDNKQDVDVKLLRKILKRLYEPCKQTNKALETILSKVKVVENNTSTILKKNGKGCKCTDIFSNITKMNEDQRRFIAEQFKEQKSFLGDITKASPKHSLETTEADEEIFYMNTTPQEEDITSTTAEPVTEPTKKPYVQTKPKSLDSNGCHVPNDSLLPFGVVQFNQPDLNEIGRDYNTRFCMKGWTVIQRRDNYDIQENFNRSWYDYKHGFGDLDKDFWFGNEYISKLTFNREMMLRIELEDFDLNRAWVEYGSFKVFPVEDAFRLLLGNFSGSASKLPFADSFSSHNLSLFSTYDRKNDDAPECCPCALSYGGGWWFNSCFESNLNGVYYNSQHTNAYYKGIIWENWLGNYSLKMATMMVKPAKPEQTNIGYIDPQQKKPPFFIEDP